MNPTLSQAEQRELNVAFQDANAHPPAHGSLFLSNDQVYQFLRTTTSPGIWKYVCPQQGTDSYGVHYQLTEEIQVNLPPLQLMAVVLETQAYIPRSESEAFARFFCEILKTAGWTHPTVSAISPIPGKVLVTERDSTFSVETDDIRTVLSRLSDPTIRGLLIPTKSGETWIDLAGKTLEIYPDATE